MFSVSAELAAFVGVSLLVIATPGQDTALTIRNTLLGGRRVGVFTALGVSTGQASWTLAASAGVAALLVASEPAFLAVKLLGAAYLVYLGVEALLAAARSGASERFAIARGRIRHLAPGTAYRQGVVSNLGNPKMAVFFTSLLPQFAPSGAGSFWAMLVLGLLFCSFTLVWLAGYAVAVAKAGDLLRRPKIRRSLEGLMGAVLVALGLRLASEGR
jgi:threonine/homoserine/homoserine lactone efflux protein